MCSHTTYLQMLAAVKQRIDKGYSAESACAAVCADWQSDTGDTCELLADALDYQSITYRLED